jgi:sugar phosphate isomerase/epimerase
MQLGLYGAILHDRPLPDAIQVVANVGLTGLEINTGGFLPAVHVPAFGDILVSDTARDDFLGIFEGTSVSISGLNANGNPLVTIAAEVLKAADARLRESLES